MSRSGTAVLTVVLLLSVIASGGYRSGSQVAIPSGSESLTAGKMSAQPRTAGSPLPYSGPEEPQRYPEELADALRRFYSGAPGTTNTSVSCPEPYDQLKSGIVPPSTQPDFLLAIVPDPVHTHLALFFDRQIEAIQQAAQDNGYFFDQAIMPWDYRSHAEPADFRLRESERRYQKEREKEPGLMIFRSSIPGRNALIVPVVAETPTGGIRKDEFREALNLIHCLGGTDQLHLRILGPTFSGSLDSLRELLESNRGAFGGFEVYSGTISSYERAHTFLKNPPQKTTFASFQESADLQELLLVRFLVDRGFQSDHIAILTEDETAFGGLGPTTVQNSEKQESKPCGWHCGDSSLPYERYLKSVVRVSFPREIAHLRSAYQREEASPPSNNSAKETYRSTLKPDLEEVGADDDSVHTYSRQQSPLSQESILLAIVTTLHKHAAEFVLLRATDPFDEVFLARYLRKAAPNLRVITEGNDLLLRREVEDRLLYGTLSVSTYSMRPGANDILSNLEDRTPHQERVFSGPASVGTYNAVTALFSLCKSSDSSGQTHGDPSEPISPGKSANVSLVATTKVENKSESTSPEKSRIKLSSCLNLEEYGWPELGGVVPDGAFIGSPPVWLTVLGRDGFRPVTLLTPKPTQAEKEPHSLLPIQEQPAGKSVSTKALRSSICKILGGGLIAALLFCLYMRFVWRSSAKADSWFGPIKLRRIWAPVAIILIPWPWFEQLFVEQEPNRVTETLAWKALCTIVIAVSLLYIWFARQGSIRSTSQISQQFAEQENDCRLRVFALQWFLLLVGLLLVLWPWLHRRVNGCWGWSVALAVATIAVGASGATDLQRRWRKGGRVWETGFTIFFSLLGSSLLILFLAVLYRPNDDAVYNMFVYRYLHWAWWVSPLTPVLFLIGAGLWWAWYTVQGAALLDQRRTRLPETDQANQESPTPTKLPKDLKHLSEDDLEPLLCTLIPKWDGRVHWPILALSALALILVDVCHPVSSLEPHWFDWVYGGALLLTIAGVLGDLLRLYFIWVDTRRLLLRLDATPLRRGFRRLPGFSWMPFWGVGHLFDRERLSRTQVQALQTAVRTADLERDYASQRDLSTELQAVREKEGQVQADTTDKDRLEHVEALNKEVAKAVAVALRHLSDKWKTEKYREPDDSTKAAEDFVALVYASFIQVVLIRMRSLMISTCGMFVFIVASLNVYPFQPSGMLRTLSILLLIVIIFVVGLVFTQVRRDATLSRITNTTPGKLGRDFWLKVLQFGTLPLLSLLAAQFPEVAGFFLSWLEPALQALR